jgi:hypothetical protein
MGAQLSFKKLITKAKISTLLQDIHRSKLVDISIVDARFGKTCWSMVFLPMASNISPQKKIEMKKPHGGISVGLIFEAKCSHDWTKACNPCMYKEPNT